MKKFALLIAFFSLSLLAANKQTVSSEQWTAQYKGEGKLSLYEGYTIVRAPIFTGLNFSHYEYIFTNKDDVNFLGEESKIATFFIENSDEKAVLKIKPKKNVKIVTQFIQVIASNSNFKTVKILVKPDNVHYVFGVEEFSGVIIDGNVGKFINTAPTFANVFAFKNVGTFISSSLEFTYLSFGQPDHVVSNAYTDYNGNTNNTIIIFSEGNVNKFIVKRGINNSFILAGADMITDAYTSDMAAIYSNYPPSGKIGLLKAKLISSNGRYKSGWIPLTQIISSEIKKFKVKQDTIVGENKSVFIMK